MASGSRPVSFLDHLIMLDFLQHVPPLIIFPRYASGQIGPQYPPGEPPHLVSAINICRAMMHHPKGRQAFRTLAVRFSIGRPTAWYLQGPNAMTMDQVANNFINLILARFPIVFVDYALGNPDTKGFHTRREWYGSFEPTHQAISLNGSMIDRMSTAFQSAIQSTIGGIITFRESELQLFKAHLFNVASVLFHEMGHVFLTYLTQGKESTPPHINDPTVSASETEGEAGRALEYIMFGGTLHWFSISGTPEGECSTAYLKKPSGGFYRILQSTIDDITSFRLNFPYETEQSTEQRTLILQGEGYPPDVRTDPLEREEVAYLLK